MIRKPMGVFLVISITIVSVTIAYGVSQVPPGLRGATVLALFVMIPVLIIAATRGRGSLPQANPVRRRPARTVPRRRRRRRDDRPRTRGLHIMAAEVSVGSRVTIR